jgi:hypothetical protein
MPPEADDRASLVDMLELTREAAAFARGRFESIRHDDHSHH